MRYTCLIIIGWLILAVSRLFSVYVVCSVSFDTNLVAFEIEIRIFLAYKTLSHIGFCDA